MAAEELSFSKVLNQLRSDLATHYLSDADLSISQIAWLVGYQGIGAFSHSYKRWTGLNAKKMRAIRKTFLLARRAIAASNATCDKCVRSGLGDQPRAAATAFAVMLPTAIAFQCPPALRRWTPIAQSVATDCAVGTGG
jgi:hypothetical protein